MKLSSAGESPRQLELMPGWRLLAEGPFADFAEFHQMELN